MEKAVVEMVKAPIGHVGAAVSLDSLICTS